MAQLPLDLGHRPALGGADFLVAPSNAAAVAWLDRWPDWPGPALVLVGPAGSGKTHLAHVFAARAGAIRLGAADVTVSDLCDRLGAAHAAVLDRAEAAEEEAFLHLYNMLAERGGHLLAIARQAPARWDIGLADLRSRLRAAPVASIAPPDDALLSAVLVKLFADRQVQVGEDVVAYLLARLERSFAAAQRAVAALDRAALAAQRRVTVPLVRAVLDEASGRDAPGEG
ncbi:MAG TPA: DnaA/Hda family protein [Stellaceae bacterium]|nr:DnaA/Hda family protein [Stellaceae bacterium]